jgi:hypothetical protein
MTMLVLRTPPRAACEQMARIATEVGHSPAEEDGMSTFLDLMGPEGVDVAADVAMQWRKHRGRGDYLEFGTFRGRSFTSFFRAAEKYGLDDVRFFGFDSFEGLPETITCGPARPGGSPDAFAAGNYACSRDEFEATLTTNGVDMSRVTLVPGFYNESLTQALKTELAVESAGIVNVDCDIYESTVDVLSFVTDYLRTGSLLLFDDWLAYAHPFRGEPKACHEWLAANPQIYLTEYFKYTETGVAFIVTILSQREQELAGRNDATRRNDATDVVPRDRTPTRLGRSFRAVRSRL